MLHSTSADGTSGASNIAALVLLTFKTFRTYMYTLPLSIDSTMSRCSVQVQATAADERGVMIKGSVQQATSTIHTTGSGLQDLVQSQLLFLGQGTKAGSTCMYSHTFALCAVTDMGFSYEKPMQLVLDAFMPMNAVFHTEIAITDIASMGTPMHLSVNGHSNGCIS